MFLKEIEMDLISTMKKTSGGGELPEHLVEMILSWLPMESVLKFCQVSKDWIAFLFSTRFINLWTQPPNKNPWALFSRRIPYLDCNPAFCFSTYTWKTISFSFLPEWEAYEFVASAKGLLLCCGITTKEPTFTFFVCNPIRRSKLQLPPLISMVGDPWCVGIMGGQDDTDSYKVVAASGRSNTIQIYDSCTKSWKIAFVLPKGFEVKFGSAVILCKGFLICKTENPRDIMVYNIQSEEVKASITFVPFPCWPFPCADGSLWWSAVIKCGLSVLLIGASKDHFILWEFEMKSTWNWKEIVRMPPLLYCEFKEMDPCTYDLNYWGGFFWIECLYFGAGDYMCFKKRNSKTVFVYDLRKHSWHWLPPFPKAYKEILGWSLSMGMGFEPRPDMKL